LIKLLLEMDLFYPCKPGEILQPKICPLITVQDLLELANPFAQKIEEYFSSSLHFPESVFSFSGVSQMGNFLLPAFVPWPFNALMGTESEQLFFKNQLTTFLQQFPYLLRESRKPDHHTAKQ